MGISRVLRLLVLLQTLLSHLTMRSRRRERLQKTWKMRVRWKGAMLQTVLHERRMKRRRRTTKCQQLAWQRQWPCQNPGIIFPLPQGIQRRIPASTSTSI